MTLKYSEDVLEAAQIARQAIPFVSKHDLAANPVNYAVFYEYFSGTNTPLRQAADQMVEKHGGLNQDVVADLYFRFVANDDPEFVAKIQGELRSLIQSMVEAVGVAGTESDRYQTRLRAGLGKLDERSTSEKIHELISELIEDTKLIVTSNARLNKRLVTANHDLGTLQQQLEHQRSDALTDSLTGLANRRAFDQAITAAIEKATTEALPLCLLMIDIDHFKVVNDTHGHLIGDKVLRYIAGVLRESVRGEDVVARYGAEEFAVVLLNTTSEGAKHVAEKIRSRIADRPLKRVNTGIAIGQVTVSLGLALFKQAETPEQFIERADRGLYTAKQQGRNRVVAALE